MRVLIFVCVYLFCMRVFYFVCVYFILNACILFCMRVFYFVCVYFILYACILFSMRVFYFVCVYSILYACLYLWATVENILETIMQFGVWPIQSLSYSTDIFEIRCVGAPLQLAHVLIIIDDFSITIN